MSCRDGCAQQANTVDRCPLSHLSRCLASCQPVYPRMPRSKQSFLGPGSLLFTPLSPSLSNLALRSSRLDLSLILSELSSSQPSALAWSKPGSMSKKQRTGQPISHLGFVHVSRYQAHRAHLSCVPSSSPSSCDIIGS